jgi:hypothetical protein
MSRWQSQVDSDLRKADPVLNLRKAPRGERLEGQAKGGASALRGVGRGFSRLIEVKRVRHGDTALPRATSLQFLIGRAVIQSKGCDCMCRTRKESVSRILPGRR